MSLPVFKPLEEFPDYDSGSSVIRDYGNDACRHSLRILVPEHTFKAAPETESEEWEAIVMNDGVEPIYIHSFSVIGSFKATYDFPELLEAGQTSFFKIKLVAKPAGEYEGALIINSNSAGGQKTVILKGTVA